MHQYIQSDLLLPLDTFRDLLLIKCHIFFSCNLPPAESRTIRLDILCLWKRTNGCGREFRQTENLFLQSLTFTPLWQSGIILICDL